MKYILNLLFFLVIANVSAQSNYTLVEIPKLNTGIYGDVLVRTITAGEDGAKIRFGNHDFDKAFWNQDSLLNHLMVKYELDSSATAKDIASSVGDFIKYGNIASRVKSYGLAARIIDKDSMEVSLTNNFKDVFNFHTFFSSDFSFQFCEITKSLAFKLGVDLKVATLSLNGFVVAEYFDESLEKWVIVDVDPQSKIFMPSIKSVPLSFDELLNNPELILEDDNFLRKKYTNKVDSIFTSGYYKEYLSRLVGIAGSEEYQRMEFPKRDFKFDYYLQLAPNQSLEWSYTVEALYLNENKCDDEFLNIMDKYKTNDSATVINAMIAYSKCHDADPYHVVPRIANESPLFADSTYYGKNNLRVNSFETTLPKGKYESSQVYIPNLIKSIKGDLVLENKGSLSNFELELFDFEDKQDKTSKTISKELLHQLDAGFEVSSEQVTIEFYSNDKLNFEVNNTFEIAVLEGDISVEHVKNGKIISVVSSLEE